MKHKLVVLVENNPGVLSKVAGLFGRRGYNIDSLAVSETENRKVSRMTIVVEGDHRIIEQVTKQLHKLIDVIKVHDVTSKETVDRQLLLIKVATDNNTKIEIIQLMDVFRARIVNIGRKSLTIEATGDEGKIQAIISSLKPFGIKELVRTGTISMLR